MLSNQLLWEKVHIHRNQLWWYSNASKICCQQNLVSSLHLGLNFHRVWRIFPVYSLMGQLPIHCYIIQGYKYQLEMTQSYKFDVHNSVRIYTCGYVMPREFQLQISTGLCFLVDYNIHKIYIFLSFKVFIKLQLFGNLSFYIWAHLCILTICMHWFQLLPCNYSHLTHKSNCYKSKHFIITYNYHMYLEEQFCKNSPLFDEWGLI